MKRCRIVAHHFPVLAGAGLGFVRIDDEIVRPVANLFGHERPFQSRWEIRPRRARAIRDSLILLDDPVMAPRRIKLKRFRSRRRAFSPPSSRQSCKP